MDPFLSPSNVIETIPHALLERLASPFEVVGIRVPKLDAGKVLKLLKNQYDCTECVCICFLSHSFRNLILTKFRSVVLDPQADEEFRVVLVQESVSEDGTVASVVMLVASPSQNCLLQ